MPKYAGDGIQVKNAELKEPEQTLYLNLPAALHAAIAERHGVGTRIKDG